MSSDAIISTAEYLRRINEIRHALDNIVSEINSLPIPLTNVKSPGLVLGKEVSLKSAILTAQGFTTDLDAIAVENLTRIILDDKPNWD